MSMQDLEDCSEMLKLASRCCVVHSRFIHLYEKFMYVIVCVFPISFCSLHGHNEQLPMSPCHRKSRSRFGAVNLFYLLVPQSIQS